MVWATIVSANQICEFEKAGKQGVKNLVNQKQTKHGEPTGRFTFRLSPHHIVPGENSIFAHGFLFFFGSQYYRFHFGILPYRNGG